MRILVTCILFLAAAFIPWFVGTCYQYHDDVFHREGAPWVYGRDYPLVTWFIGMGRLGLLFVLAALIALIGCWCWDAAGALT